jgi:hypothetical protein
MDGELAAAVERLKAMRKASDEHDGGYPATDEGRWQSMHDHTVIANAVLPEFDETPVDKAWLRSICGSYEYDNDNSVAFYLVRQLSGDNLLSLCVSNSSGRFSCSLAKLCDGPMKDSPWIDLEVVGAQLPH